MYTATKVTILALGLAVAGAVAARAQSASISVTAAVQQPITVTAGSPLAFGNVFPGVAKSIPVISGGAGTFTVAGQGSAPVSMTFVLPLTLLGPGANTLPIGTWVANWNTVNSATGTGFTPSVSATSATLSAGGQLWVFVGATVTPVVTQVAGAYSGTVSMTVTY